MFHVFFNYLFYSINEYYYLNCLSYSCALETHATRHASKAIWIWIWNLRQRERALKQDREDFPFLNGTRVSGIKPGLSLGFDRHYTHTHVNVPRHGQRNRIYTSLRQKHVHRFWRSYVHLSSCSVHLLSHLLLPQNYATSCAQAGDEDSNRSTTQKLSYIVVVTLSQTMICFEARTSLNYTHKHSSVFSANDMFKWFWF